MEYIIIITRDEEANVWIAENYDIPIVMEDESLNELMEKVKNAAIEICEMNNLPKPKSLYFAIQAMIREALVTNG